MSQWTVPGRILTGVVSAAVIAAAAASMTGSQRAATLGTTTIGDLVTHGDAGATRLAIGADGSVLTSLGGRAQWAAAAGGVSAAAGTFAARPAACAEGDSYRVTSGARIGSIYRCAPANTWGLDAIDWELVCGVRPQMAYDAEDLLPFVGGTVTRWRERQMGADLGVLGAPGGTIAGLDGASSWGSLAAAEWGDAATSPRLRATVPGPLSTAARSLVVVVSSVSSTGSQIAAGWGAATAGGSAWNLGVRMSGSANTGLELFAAGGTGSGATPTGDTPTVLVATYDGSAYALAQAEITSGTPSWTESIAATTLAIATGARDADGPLTLGGYSAVGTSWPLKGRIHGAMVFPWALSSGERDALVNGLYARWQ